jgi:hypothetical protein
VFTLEAPREFVPGHVYNESDESTWWWIGPDGKITYRKNHPLTGADIATFRFYPGGFAKDRKHCYGHWGKLPGGNSRTFSVLNYSYATDGRWVWTIGGRVEGADAASFVVLDDGTRNGAYHERVGYAKDRERVFFAHSGNQAKWVRQASPESFESLNDGRFAKDHNGVFFGSIPLPKVNPAQWRRLGGSYSKDDTRIYYGDACITKADYESFEVLLTEEGAFARDKKRCYLGAEFIEPQRLKGLLDRQLRRALFDSRWLTSSVVDLARTIREELAYDRLGILCDALMDAGCNEAEIVEQWRKPYPSRLGSWVVDLILFESANGESNPLVPESPQR